MENSPPPPHSKTAPPQTSEFAKLDEISVSILVKTFFFFFGDHLILGGKNLWRSPKFGRKKPLNFGFRPQNHSEFWRRPFFFFFWRSPKFGRKKPLNFRAFRNISSQFSDNPSETDSRSMKTRVKVVCTLLTLSK